MQHPKVTPIHLVQVTILGLWLCTVHASGSYSEEGWW